MIKSITSSIPTFKTLTFGKGLNILLADLTEKSTDKQTRNSAGKTSMIEIMHFLMGSDADKGSLFKKFSEADYSFTAVFEIFGHDVAVTRKTSNVKKILIEKERAKLLGLEVKRDEASGVEFVSVETWKDFLGQAWFKLPMERKGTAFEGSYSPTFRSLIGYFARRRRAGGYSSIQKQNGNQQPWDWQVNLSYLIGLDWKIPRDIQIVQSRNKNLSNMKKAVRAGELGSVFGTAAEIRPELVRAEARIAEIKKRIDSFQVLESYRELADEVARLKSRMTEITADLALANETINYLSNSMKDEKPPAYAAIETLYSEAGIQLPGVAVRRFDEVQEFQNSVVANRKHYLEAEIEKARSAQSDLVVELRVSDDRKSELLRTLDGKGAFEDLMAMHAQYAEISSRADQLRTKLQNATILESQLTQTKRDSADLELKLQEDHKNEEAAINNATAKVDCAISELYDDRKGNLIVAPSKSGPKIDIAIQGDGNRGGIDQMKIFCFDSMLYEVTGERLGGPGFLAHDSHLFDGVDKRQVYLAVLFGAKVAERKHGQYIVAMNSDEFSGTLDAAEASGKGAERHVLENAVMEVRLTDHEAGGLFGFRFD
jgi:uncharacterized protein YydD (DUF2326 family)